MKVTVSGASGFVGRHVVAELQRRGISPVLLCRPSTQRPVWFAGHAVASVDLYQTPEEVFDRIGRPDVMIHLAWGGLPRYKSLQHFEQELPAHYRFLKQLVESGLGRLLVTGTCLEYGMQSGCLREDAETRPTTPYGFAKDALRRQLQYLRQSSPFELTWARLFFLYGDGQAETSLLPQLRKAVERGDREFRMSNGDQLRDYLPVTTLARQLVCLALGSGDYGIVNVCSGVPVSVRGMVERWICENGWAIELKLGCYPYPDYEPLAFWGDRGKLEKCQNLQ